jgi:hypothetical protein
MTNISTVAIQTPACSGLAPNQQDCLEAVMAQAKALNAAIAKAVDAGLIIEVGRASRYHTEQANWGDQIAPMVQPRF